MKDSREYKMRMMLVDSINCSTTPQSRTTYIRTLDVFDKLFPEIVEYVEHEQSSIEE